MEHLLSNIIETYKDNYTIKVATILYMMSSSAYSLGLIAAELDKRYAKTGRVWLVLYIIANLIVIFRIKDPPELSLCLGVFLTLSFFTVSSWLYDFAPTWNFDPLIHTITAREYITIAMFIILGVFYYIRYLIHIDFIKPGRFL